MVSVAEVAYRVPVVIQRGNKQAVWVKTLRLDTRTEFFSIRRQLQEVSYLNVSLVHSHILCVCVCGIHVLPYY
jgi:hypothetical protein